MPSNLHDPNTEIRPLPQCGFGEDVDFNTLIESNRFIFRVFSPKEKSPFSDPSDPFFVAPKFDEQFTRSPVDLPDATVKFPELMAGSYSDVARHMEWTTRSTSPYISTSFSFSWSIWEAVRRYHFGVKKDVQIAIIDASALEGRAATAVQLLQNSSPDQYVVVFSSLHFYLNKPLRRDQQFWKWHRFSHDSQSVLVYGMIPRPAVLASIPIFQILRKMPSYFLRKDAQILDGNPLDQLAWDYAKQKSSYRRFCQDMSKLFSSRPAEVRLRDCTAGAVRLALSFLRPFFHHVVQEDFEVALSYLRTFALTISQWPSQSWVNDHPEVHKVIESMVLALGEELREKYRRQQQEEISRLQVIIDGLQYAVRTQDSQTVLNNVEVDSDGDFEIEYEESDEPTLVTMLPPSVRKRPSVEMSIAVLPRMPVSFQTPITPPDSPSRPSFIPTVVVPISNAIMPTSIPKFVLQDGDRDGGDISSSTPSELSAESSVPPPTRSFPSPVFSPPSVHRVAKFEASTSVSSYRDENNSQEHATSQPCIVEQQPFVDQSSTAELEAQYNEDGNESLTGSLSTLPSRRSSIVSNDTLCETSEFPFKRFSIASYDSGSIFDSIPVLTKEIPSRSASFSEPWSVTPELGDSIVQAPPSEADPSVIPLPASPSSLAANDSIPSSLLSSPITPQMPIPLADLQSTSSEVILPKSGIGLIGPLQMAQDADVDEDNDRSTVVETASYIVTGFLVGAFITLFLFSTQRRTLLYLT